MSAICPSCNWTGTSTQVVDGGRCPECRDKVRYESGTVSNKVLAVGIKTSEDFNQRAAKAESGIKHLSPFLKSISASIRMGACLSAKQQQALYNTVHAHRHQITDHDLKEYAAMHAKGAD